MALHPDAILATGPDASNEPLLAVDEIQGNVLPGFAAGFITFVGLKIVAGGEAAARQWLSNLSREITTLGQMHTVREVRRAVARVVGKRPVEPDLLLNIVLAHAAIRAFALDDARIEPTFKAGMKGAAFRDPRDTSGPIGWRVGDTEEKSPDILLILASDVEATVTARTAALQAVDPAHDGVRVTYVEAGVRLPGEIEHFGFRDGISQPGVRGRLSERPDQVLTRRYFDAADPRAMSFSRPGQPLLWPGQFLFGYPTQLDDDPTVPGPVAKPPAPWMQNGSFMVYRRLQQHVDRFRHFAAAQAPGISAKLGREVTPAEVEALLVGRWPDGTPLVRSPHGPDPLMADDDDQVNFFGFASDEADALVADLGVRRTVPGAVADDNGARCPHFAHVRKVNPRDKNTDQGPSHRFRVLRRGITFGPPFAEGEEAPVDRGLLFVSYQRVLDPQFMTLVSTWMNAPDAPEGFGHDLLVGQSGQPRFGEIKGERVLETTAANEWITPTGGMFFFSPAVSVLRNL